LYVSPTSATLSAFHAFAKANGLAVSSLSDTNEWIEFATNVSHANTLFDANYQRYTHTATGANLTRTLAYSLPKELVGHVDTLTPATGFEIHPRFATKFEPVKDATVPAECNTLANNSSMTPKCLQARLFHPPLYQGAQITQEIYDVPANLTKSNTTLLVTGYEGEYVNHKDVVAFLERERPDVDSNMTFTFVSLDNGTDPQGAEMAGYAIYPAAC
jgi:tripeptidyl-peptidase-1